MVRTLLLLLFFAASAAACTCHISLNVCRETASISTVFVGTVESIEPGFLSKWNLTQRTDLLHLNEEYARVRQNPSPEGIAKIKESYLRIFPDLPEDRRRKLDSARRPRDLASLFYSVLGDGKQIGFRVRTSFKQEGEAEESILVWTPFGDCGYDFQLGETYLVYADEDEETAVLSTGVCTRTRRLTDAGDDLAYLFFLKNDPDRSARLEGFATTNELYQADADKLRDPEKIKSPVPGVMIALESPAGRRYVKTGESGKFVFDGLAAGAYNLSAFTGEYPREVKLLSGPKQVKVEAKACINEMLLLPK